MKNLLTAIFILCLSGFCMAQNSGTIEYTETIKLDIQLPDGMEIDGMMDQSMTVNKQLHFDNSISIYKDAKGNESTDHEMTSDDGNFQIVMKMDDTENIFYNNFSEKMSTHQTGFMGKEFLIEEKMPKRKWKLTGEKIKYLGYVCQKATTTIMEEEEKAPSKIGIPNQSIGEIDVTAWFTSEIPAPIGPDEFNQLPGAILMLSKNEGKTEIKATSVKLEAVDAELLSKPKNGKKVSRAEYEKIVTEKMKEMKENSGGGIHMIRG